MTDTWLGKTKQYKNKKGARETGPPVFTGIGMVQKGEGGRGDGPGAGRAHPEAAVMAATVSSLPSLPPVSPAPWTHRHSR